MKTTGIIKDTGRYTSGKYYIVLQIEGDLDTALMDKDLDIEIRAHREKRSIEANAYFYKLLSLMAEKLHTSTNEVHNLMISRYGYPDIVGDSLVYIPLRADIDANKVEGIHLQSSGRVTENSKGTKFIQYILMRGSHTYNTLEMSHLIDGTISEAAELGIDTLTPAEKERMMALYEKHHTRG